MEFINKSLKHQEICKGLNKLYEDKNKDYGDSFGKSFKEYGLTMACIRLEDKLNRLKSLSKNKEQSVKDETITDTLMDLANYSIMTIMELDNNLKVSEYIDSFKIDEMSLKCKIEKFADQHNKFECRFDDAEAFKWIIGYNFINDKLYVWETEIQNSAFGEIYFSSEDVAEMCMKNYKKELIAYFKNKAKE